MVNVRVIARGLPEVPRMPERLEIPVTSKGHSPGPAQRDVYFGPNRGWTSVTVLDRFEVDPEIRTGG